MVIEDTEIINYFNDAKEIELNLERMEQIFAFLEGNNVDILTITDDDGDDEILINDDIEEDVEKIDISVPDGVSIEDHVRMFLKEIGKVPLLCAEVEIGHA